jgi:mono/diheme cytochrome c family protein
MASAPPPAAPVLATVTRGVGPAVRVASTTHPEASIGPLPAPEVRPPPAAAVDEPVVDAGEPRPVHVEHELAPSPPPARATSAPPPARVAAATPRVTSDGDAVAGERVVAACNACHTRTGAAPIEGHQLSRVQWERFFATGKHDRYVALGDQLSAIQLSAARAFLRARAYDAPENQGAGIREP